MSFRRLFHMDRSPIIGAYAHLHPGRPGCGLDRNRGRGLRDATQVGADPIHVLVAAIAVRTQGEGGQAAHSCASWPGRSAAHRSRDRRHLGGGAGSASLRSPGGNAQASLGRRPHLRPDFLTRRPGAGTFHPCGTHHPDTGGTGLDTKSAGASVLDSRARTGL